MVRASAPRAAQRTSGINLIIYTLMGDENDKPTCKKS